MTVELVAATLRKVRWTQVVLLGLALRTLSWIQRDGPVIRGDSAGYVEWAEALASGDYGGFSDYPLHQLYPALLAPAVGFGLPIAGYSLALHSLLAAGALWLGFRVLRLSVSHGLAVAGALAVALSANLILWFSHLLTETLFIAILAITLFASAHWWREPSVARMLFALPPLSLLLVARPVSLPLVVTMVLVGAFWHLRARHTARGALIRALALPALLSLLCGMWLAADEDLRDRLLRYPTVAQSLWLSTRLVTNNIEEQVRVVQVEDRKTFAAYQNDPETLYRIKASRATEFIASDPPRYLGMAATRWTAFWYPWLFATGWSTAHLLHDAAVSLFFTLGAVLVLCRRQHRSDPVLIGILLMALSQSVLVAFSQIDSDARYRLPAEFLLLLIAPIGWASAVRLLRPRRSPS